MMWLQQLERDLIGTGRGYSWLDWDIYMKGKFIRPLLLEEDPEGYKVFFDDADRLVAESHSQNWAKRIILDELKADDLNEQHMSLYLGQVQQHALHELDVLLLTPKNMADAYECLIRDPVGAAKA